MPTSKSHLDFLSGYLNRSSHVSGLVAGAMMLQGFDDMFGLVNEADGAFEAANAKGWNEVVEWFRTTLTGTKIDADLTISAAADDVATMLTDVYTESVDQVFREDHSGDLKRRFVLSADKRATEEAKIKGILQGQFRDALIKAKELEQRRSWLLSSLDSYAALPDEEFDLVGAAKNFGLGALAAANPLIGVPALIGNWFSGEEKKKASSARDEQFESTFREYMDQLEVLRSLLLKGREQTQKYITQKWREVNLEGVRAMAKLAAESGLRIDQFPTAEDIKALEELEADFEVSQEKP